MHLLQYSSHNVFSPCYLQRLVFIDNIKGRWQQPSGRKNGIWIHKYLDLLTYNNILKILQLAEKNNLVLFCLDLLPITNTTESHLTEGENAAEYLAQPTHICLLYCAKMQKPHTQFLWLAYGLLHVERSSVSYL